jgi:hypothetical protein
LRTENIKKRTSPQIKRDHWEENPSADRLRVCGPHLWMNG